MLKIVRVGAIDSDTIDIQFSNGNIVMIELAHIKSDPEFTPLWEDEQILHPKTDGDSIYWQDGTRLTLAKIMEFLQNNTITKENNNE